MNKQNRNTLTVTRRGGGLGDWVKKVIEKYKLVAIK